MNTVKPVLSGPVLNGHPLLSAQLSKFQKFILLITLNVTFIKQSPLLSSRDVLRRALMVAVTFYKVTARVFLLFSPVLSGHFIKGNHTNMP